VAPTCGEATAEDQMALAAALTSVRTVTYRRRTILPLQAPPDYQLGLVKCVATGQQPGRQATRTQPMLGKATKSSTTRQYERPGTAGSSSRRHRRARTRGSAPAERKINRTQALRFMPSTRFAAGGARLGLHPVLLSPAQREAERCHDQHKLTQHMSGR
jgi:hypothetical protein